MPFVQRGAKTDKQKIGGAIMIHAVKTLSNFFQDSINGDKPFEVRFNDRDYKVGDYIAQNEYKDGHYTGRSALSLITYILDNPEYLRDGYVVLGLKPCSIQLSAHTQDGSSANTRGESESGQKEPEQWTPKAGDKVRFVNGELHIKSPVCYPAVGTIGEVFHSVTENNSLRVQWPKGSTSHKDNWWCGLSDVEPVEEE